MVFLRLWFCSVLLLAPAVALAQAPPPVDLPIQNLPQETPVWCWAAVAQQIIAATRGPHSTPAQCALVAMANNAPPQACCGFGGVGTMNPGCVRTGAIEQIQMLIAAFGGHWSHQAPPADPLTLYRTLLSGRAIILHLRSGFASSHVVVLRGMSFIPDAFGNVVPVLHVNDPMAYFTQPVPYMQILGSWINAIVVHTGSPIGSALPAPTPPSHALNVSATGNRASYRFEVTEAEGVSVELGAACIATVRQVRVGQCRVRVTCGGVLVYGRGSGGYVPCQAPGQRQLSDPETTADDNDPAIMLDRADGHLEVRDDDSGPLGAYRIVGRASH